MKKKIHIAFAIHHSNLNLSKKKKKQRISRTIDNVHNK